MSAPSTVELLAQAKPCPECGGKIFHVPECARIEEDPGHENSPLGEVVCAACRHEFEHAAYDGECQLPANAVIACPACGSTLMLDGYDCDGDSEHLRMYWGWTVTVKAIR